MDDSQRLVKLETILTGADGTNGVCGRLRKVEEGLTMIENVVERLSTLDEFKNALRKMRLTTAGVIFACLSSSSAVIGLIVTLLTKKP